MSDVLHPVKKIFHWLDSVRDLDEGVFQIADSPGPAVMPPRATLPPILCSPAACARLKQDSEPLAQKILERGLMFSKERLEQIRDAACAEIERHNQRIPGTDKSARGLLARYGGWGSRPLGGINPTRECELWRAALDERSDEISAVMERLRWKRHAALAENVWQSLDGESRSHGALWASGISGVFSEFDPRVVSFPSLLDAVTGPSGRSIICLSTPDLSLRSLAWVTEDKRLRETFADADPWLRVWRDTHREGTERETPESRTQAREVLSSLILADGQKTANEAFCRLYLDPVVERYASWLKSCGGLTLWTREIEAATGDSEMRGSSFYSTPNQRRACEAREQLLRENGLTAHWLAGLAIAAALSSGGYKMAPPLEPSHRGPGRPKKETVTMVTIPPEPPQLLGAVADTFIVECPTGQADTLAATLKERLEQFFAEHFPSFPLTVETQPLKETK